MKRTENDLKKACLGMLETLERSGGVIWYTRLNSGQVPVIYGLKRYYMYLCRSGTPDMLAILPSGHILWVETKIGKNGLSEDQIKFKLKVWQFESHIYLECRDVLEMMAAIAEVNKK